mgnify:CR=1 FL=1
MQNLKNLINKVTTGNCVDLMKCLPDSSIDMCITSPPYDNLRTYKGYNFPFEDIVEELFRIIKNGGIVVWVVNDATINGTETGTSFKQALKFKEIGFNIHDTMIFLKTNPIPQIYRKRYTNVFEYMFVFSKGTVKTHNPLTVPCMHAGLELKGTTYKNFSTGAQTRGKMAKPVKEDKIRGNVWEYVVGKKAVDQEAKGHPAPFPYDLAKDHIMSWTNEGDIVLDPMCGSGTSLVAAYDLKRQFVGFDISEEYCVLAKNRLKKHQNTAQCDLFSTVISNESFKNVLRQI